MSLFITHHRGKLQGIRSINVSPTTSIFCQHTALPICRKCYAKRILKTYGKKGIPHYEANAELLKSPLRKFPHYKDAIFRFDSFGEIDTAEQLQNFYDIAAQNPNTRHALWTKRADLVAANLIHPTNLNVIYGDPMIDNPSPQIPPGFDSIFSVFSTDDGVNCPKKCNSCRKCYEQRRLFIREKVK